MQVRVRVRALLEQRRRVLTVTASKKQTAQKQRESRVAPCNTPIAETARTRETAEQQLAGSGLSKVLVRCNLSVDSSRQQEAGSDSSQFQRHFKRKWGAQQNRTIGGER